MATIVAAAGGGNWTTGSTWVGGSAPGAGDDAQLTNTSGNVTIDTGGAVCRSLDCTGYTGVLTHAAAATLTIGDGTAGAGNIALKLVAGMTYTKNNNTTSRLTFVSTSGTQQSITWAGKTAGNTTFSGVGSSYLFADAFTGAAAATTILTLNNGILNTNGKAVTTGSVQLSGTSAARTLTCGATTFTLASTGTPWDASNTSNLTFNFDTSTITSTGSGPIFQGGGLTYNNVNFTGGALKEIAGANTYANFSVVGTANLLNILQLDANQTVTTLLTLTGNSAVNRMLITSNTISTPRTITAASVSLTDVDFQDITGAGAASPFTGTRLGDAQGNSGITMTTPKNAYWVGTTSNWSVANRWAATSGGATAANNYPLPQDTAVFDANSFAVDGNSVSFNSQAVQRHSGIDASAVDQTFTIDGGASLWRPVGSIVLSNKATILNIPEWIGRGSSILTAGGATIANLTINGPGGTLTQQDALTLSGTLTDTAGTYNANGQAISVGAVTGGVNGPINFSTSTWTFTGTGTLINLIGTHTTENANLVVNNLSSASNFTLISSRTFNSLTITGGTSVFSFPGFIGPQTLTLNSLTVTPGGSAKNIRFQNAMTFRINGVLSLVGASGQVITIDTPAAGNSATISKPNGTVIADWLSLKDSVASGGANFYAGANSTNVSGNTGWIFKDGKQAQMMLAA